MPGPGRVSFGSILFHLVQRCTLVSGYGLSIHIHIHIYPSMIDRQVACCCVVIRRWGTTLDSVNRKLERGGLLRSMHTLHWLAARGVPPALETSTAQRRSPHFPYGQWGGPISRSARVATRLGRFLICGTRTARAGGGRGKRLTQARTHTPTGTRENIQPHPLKGSLTGHRLLDIAIGTTFKIGFDGCLCISHGYREFHRRLRIIQVNKMLWGIHEN